MNINIKVENLFGQFNYHLELSGDISIITGLNGTGKTTILKLIHLLCIKEFNELLDIDFARYELTYNEHIFEVRKYKVNSLNILYNGDEILDFNRVDFEQRARNLAFTKPFAYNKKWLHVNLIQHLQQIPNIPATSERDIINQAYFIKNENLNTIWELLPKTIFISADRVFRRNDVNEPYNSQPSASVINSYSNEITNIFNQKINEYSNSSQKLDHEFMNKIVNFDNDVITSDDYGTKVEEINKINKALIEYGVLNDLVGTMTPFDQEHAKVFTIYIKNLIDKLSEFSPLIQKCNLFVDILNQKRFTNKQIHITKDSGIIAKHGDKQIDLGSLSNGEQNQLIMLFELIFRGDDNKVILIDEPELGLHVAWQMEFLDDLRSILAINRMMSVICTHSPQIIKDSWECVIDLGENSEQQSN